MWCPASRGGRNSFPPKRQRLNKVHQPAQIRSVTKGSGLAKQRVSVWVYEGHLNIEYQQSLLARYTCKVGRRPKSLTAVSQPKLFQTSCASPQLEFLELDDEQWLKVRSRPSYIPGKRQKTAMHQLALIADGVLKALARDMACASGLPFVLWLLLL